MKFIYSLLITVIINLLLVNCSISPSPMKPLPTHTPTTSETELKPTPPPIETPVILPPLPEQLPEIGLRLIADYLDQPIYITHAGDGSGRLFVLERRGRIRVIEDGRLWPEPFLDIVNLVNSTDIEQGLLGLVFHPNFTHDHRFFI